MTRRRDRNEADIDPDDREVLNGLPYLPIRKKRWAMFAKEPGFFVQEGHVTGLRLKYAGPSLDGVGRLHHLKYLEASRCELQEMPAWIQGLKDLEFVSFEGNPITELPAWLDSLPRLRALDLRSSNIPDQPVLCQRWRKLEKIWDLLPLEFQGRDSRIYAEDEFAFAIQCYPYTIDAHTIRRYFPVQRPRIDPFFLGYRKDPMPVDKLISVLLKRKFNAGDNQLTFVFNAQGKMTELVIRNTPMEDLPVWIINLKALKTMRVTNCNLARFPAVLLSMPQLAAIDLSNNQITAMPPDIANLKHLKVLVTGGNPLAVVPTSTNKTLIDTAGAVFGESTIDLRALKVKKYFDYMLLGEDVEHHGIYDHTLSDMPETSQEYFKALDLHYLLLRNEVQEKYFKDYVQGLPQFQANKYQNAPILTQRDRCEEYGIEQFIYLCPATWIPPFLKYLQEERERYLTYWTARPNIYKLRDLIHACFDINVLATSAASYNYGRTGQRPLYYGWKYKLLTQACDLARTIKAPFFQWGYQMSSLGVWNRHPVILYFQLGDKQCSFHCDLTCPMPRFKGKWIGVRNEKFPVSESYLRGLIMNHHYDPAQQATYDEKELDHHVWAKIDEGEYVLRRDTMRHLREEGMLEDYALDDYEGDLDWDEDDEMADSDDADERYYGNW